MSEQVKQTQPVASVKKDVIDSAHANENTGRTPNPIKPPEPINTPDERIGSEAEAVKNALQRLEVLEKIAIDASNPVDEKTRRPEPRAGYNPHFYSSRVLAPLRKRLLEEPYNKDVINQVNALKEEREPTTEKYYKPIQFK